ncbi:hypothetical protein [Haloferula sp.]|uniref:hypothetical protein n=1 Tax=Haloferula sp. TaxID=2497595 RepID=UPI00329FF5CB
MKIILIAILSYLALISIGAGQGQASEERRIGAMVIAIDAAIKEPTEKKSLETIVGYGTDSRHYVMIRGWMKELLNGSESQLSATKDAALKQKHQTKVDFLKKVIRRIDLE